MATKSKRKQIEQTESIAVLEAVKDINLATVISEVNNLQVSVQKTLADLGATVTSKVSQMEQIDTAIDIKKNQLQELFNIEKEGFSLDDMRAKREEETLTWERNRAERQKQWNEEEAEHTKTRNRKEDDWRYEFEQQKKRTEEEFGAEVARTKRTEQLRAEALERSWAERENTLKSREQEFNSYKVQVEGFDARLDAAVKQAEARGNAVATAKFNHDIALLKKDMDSQKSMADLRIASLNETISNLHNQIENLESQLISARQDAKEVASEALKSASNRGVADALQRVVDAQQSSGTKVK